MMHCILCKSEAVTNYFNNPSHTFLKCSNCGSVFRNPSTFLSAEEEKSRYLNHNNDVNDPNYQKFVSPIVESVLNDFKAPASGLDFGAGTGPVIARLLRERRYHISLYDPFFHPDTSVFSDRYDFIVCCEVIEHFHHPLNEFQRLRKLLKKGGKLYCMTDPLDANLDFAAWYYKEDPTHVIFFMQENIHWIARNVGFTEAVQEGRLIVFTN